MGIKKKKKPKKKKIPEISYCAAAQDTWKLLKSDCKPSDGKYVDLNKDPGDNFGKNSCLTLENLNTDN